MHKDLRHGAWKLTPATRVLASLDLTSSPHSRSKMWWGYKSIGFSTETSCARTAQSEDTHQESTTSTNAKTRCGAGWWLLVVVLLGRKKVDLYSVNVLQRRHYEDIAVDVVLKAAKKCLRQRLGTQRWYKSIGFSTETSCARTAQSEDTHQESTIAAIGAALVAAVAAAATACKDGKPW